MYLLRDTKKPFAAKAKSFTIHGFMLLVVFISAVDAESAVYLLQQHDLSKMMWEGHRRHTQAHIGFGFDRIVHTLR